MAIDVESGILRIAYAFRWLARAWVALVVVGLVIALLANWPLSGSDIGMGFLFGVFIALFPAALAYGIAWLIEGFFKRGETS